VQNPIQINVLVSPLDWGIGHATRCVPIINKLLKKGCNVIIASDGRSGEFLRKEFPSLKHVSINAYHIKYPKSGKHMVLMMALQIPRIVRAIKKEHVLLMKIVRENKINLIISDNRYGLWHKNIYSVFMTHQLMLKVPKGFSFAEKIIHKMIIRLIHRYDECWVPDYEDSENISGDLSHKYKISENTHFIGPLSRFSDIDCKPDEFQKEIDILFLLSGPEPQRTIFENLILSHLSESDVKAVVLKGITEKDEEVKLNENVIVYSHLSTEKMAALIRKARIVVSRSGYSTIMDLLVLEADAVFVATPGQTEQEYLASYLTHKKLFCSIKQSEFNIKSVIDTINNPISENKQVFKNDDLLTKRIDIITEYILKK